MHIAPFHLGFSFYRRKRFEILSKAIEDVQTLFGMSHLTASKHDGDFYTRASFEEAHNVVLLCGVVAHIDLRTKLHLFDLDLYLLFAGKTCFAVLVVLKFAIVHNLAHNWIGAGRDLDKVKVLFIGDALGIAHAKQTQLRTINAY